MRGPSPSPPLPERLDPTAAAAVAPGPPTARRVEVERARRRVAVVPRTARARRTAFAGLFALDAAVGAGYLWGLPFMVWEPPRAPLVLGVLIGSACLAVFVAGGYRLGVGRRFGRGAALAGALGLALGWVALKFAGAKLGLKPLTPPAAPGMAVATLLMALWLALSRAGVRLYAARAEAGAKLLFIGAAADAAAIRARLAAHGFATPLLHFDDALPADAPTPADGAGPWPLSALDAHLAGAVKALVLGVSPQSLSPAAVADLFHYRVLNVPVLSPSQLVEELWERTPVLAADHAWYLFDERLHPGRSPVYQGVKRQLDLLLAGLGLIALAPLLLLVAAAVRLTSRGPALLHQERLGLWKIPFTLHKFRTMRADAEAAGARWTSPDDPRVTPLGRLLRRTRLDELPQLWNVLRGDMSLVGPRPERPAFTARLEAQIPYYDLRHLVRPGITGWAQVSYRYGASLDDAIAKLEYDIYYLKHASLWFDLRILARTVGVVLGLRGR